MTDTRRYTHGDEARIGFPAPGLDMTPEQQIDWWERAAYTNGARAERAEQAIAEAIRIIEAADRRATAADGPVLHVRDVMTDKEWRDLYRVLIKASRAGGA